MNANEAITYIEACSWSTTKLGLERTQALLHALGDPQKRLRFIHVAGSNGKGSTCAMLSSILQQAGFRTGLYTSPYIQTFFERIRVNGVDISENDLAQITSRVRLIADSMEDHPSQFELVTAIAMEYFAAQRCDIVVLEVGMGGALDSTNVIDAPEVAVITNIGLEHTEYLGSTLEAIAETKGGIIKTGCDCVAYPSDPAVLETLARICARLNVPLTVTDSNAVHAETNTLSGQRFSFHSWQHVKLPLLGAHQLSNAAVALTVIETLRKRGWSISDQAVYDGLRLTRWPARMEVLHPAPLFLLDGGHNPQCAQALARGIESYLPDQKVTFLIGILADKDYESMLNIVRPYGAAYICLTPDSPRALSAEALAQKLKQMGASAVSAPDCASGIEMALERGDPVIAFGSLYLAGAIRTQFPGVMKHFQRRAALAARKALSEEQRSCASQAICAHIVRSDAYRAAHSILAYNAFGSEPDLTAVIEQAQADGKRVCFPRCASKTEILALLPAAGCDWVSGAFGIREPDPASSERIAPEEIDLVLVPCAAFDRYGGRIGMGAGYYDRYLPQCSNATKMLIAFEVQRARCVFSEPTDIPMHRIATESGIVPAIEKETEA